MNLQTIDIAIGGVEYWRKSMKAKFPDDMERFLNDTKFALEELKEHRKLIKKYKKGGE